MNKIQAEMTTELMIKVFAVFPDAEISVKQKLFMGRHKDNFVQDNEDLEYTARIRRNGKLLASSVVFPVFQTEKMVANLPDLARTLLDGLQKELFKENGVTIDSNTVKETKDANSVDKI